ncbi:hypothetical protein GJAV_G00195010 [Gymnothorax javanicus]|nr:hypothetical protein GJAV_G00195010 [Gymnothorax javanicus]
MVTLITEQLQNQSLDDLANHRQSLFEPAYHRAFSISLPVCESHTPRLCWPPYGLERESVCWPLSPPARLPVTPPAGLTRADPSMVPVPDGEALRQLLLPYASVTDLLSPDSALLLDPAPLPAPPKRHCRSLSVPEDLSRCRSTWRPNASKIWSPVKRRWHSGGACPPRGGGASSSIRSASSPSFCSLVHSLDTPLPWGSSDCPSPSPPSLRPPQRRLSLSPVHIHEAATLFLPPAPLLTAVTTPPSSACSTPPSCRRPLPLPRCHSQPSDLLRKPGLKRRHAPDAQPRPRPGLDFCKMAQTRSGDPLVSSDQAYRRVDCAAPEPISGGDYRGSSSSERPGRATICPLSESEEEEDEEGDGSTVFSPLELFPPNSTITSQENGFHGDEERGKAAYSLSVSRHSQETLRRVNTAPHRLPGASYVSTLCFS